MLMEIRGLSKSFGQNNVLKNVNFTIDEGEVVGLVGENGAGKSTLMNIIFGMEFIKDTGGYEGEIILDGEKIDFKNPTDALRAGIGMVHQEFSLIPGFTVAENVTLNMEKTKQSPISKVFGRGYELIDSKANIEDTEKTLDKLGLDLDPKEYVSELPVGHKQFIEIAREIKRENIKLLIMDEPTAVLTESEADILISSLKKLAEKGIAVIFISHRLREILDLCDKVIVLRDGEIVEDREAKGLKIKQIAGWMMGKSNRQAYVDDDQREIYEDDIIFEVQNLYVEMPGEMVYDANFKVRRGEIFGLAGLAGQGKLGIANGILGTYPVKGKAVFNGEELKLSDTSSILKKKIAFVSEDRRGVGLLLGEDIALNIAFNAMEVFDKFIKKIFTFKFRDDEAIIANANKYIDSLAIKTQGPFELVGRLSGGNQQKVCLAKAFTMNPDLLFVSEPTRGIDIGAKRLVLDSLKKANREDKTTIIMISSELEELQSVCDRIGVVCEGKIVGVLDPTASAEDFGLLMSGEELVNE
ncbi:sugar ABC transporter ATP-binding protein [Anaerococcus lactolyticus]|uniref:sugar ABC transporter ATP-binding protein n=1 Tax=Anaerococcus lactolyticus TaxID=33032 RepID=UPI00288B7256|nr:sugar ABC transporter ATP-binding protein [Anaerococcus lactolyticus]